MGKSNGHSKKTNGGVRELNKKEMKGMAGGFNLEGLFFNVLSFIGKEAMKFGPEMISDGVKHFKNKK